MDKVEKFIELLEAFEYINRNPFSSWDDKQNARVELIKMYEED